MEERMTNEEFNALMELLMCCDPWLVGTKNEKIVKEWADKEARARGYRDWIEAYHLVSSVKIVLHDSNTP